MLHPSAVLRKKVRPMLRVGADFVHSVVPMAIDGCFARRHDNGHCGFTLLDYHRIGAIKEDPQSVNTAGMG